MPFEDSEKTSKLEQGSLLPELLHALNQPLTSLRCSLEVTLLQPRDSDEYRKRLRESLKLAEDITVLASGIRELIEVERPRLPPRAVAFDKVLQSSVRELLPLADSQSVRVSLVCAPSLAALGDTQALSTAIIYFFSFLLSLSSRGDDLNIRAASEGAQIVLALELRKNSIEIQKPSGSRLEKPGSARAYLRLLVARRIFEVDGGSVFIEQSSSNAAILVRFPRLLSSTAEQRVSTMLAQEELAATGTEK